MSSTTDLPDAVGDGQGDEPDPIAAAAASSGSEAPRQDRHTIRREQRRQLARTPSFVIGVVVLGFWILCSVAPGLITDYAEGDFAVAADGTSLGARMAPSADAWFGTNSIGQDVFARVVHGAGNVLTIAPIAAAIAVIAGTILGLLMGYYKGWVDEVLGRIIEAILSLPVILLALMVLVVFGSSRTVIIMTISSLFTPVVTRTIRAAVLTEADLDYVVSAKLRGESGPFIMLREILPNILSVQVVEFTVRVAYAIFTVATLAFLGLSSGDTSAADWGIDIAQNYNLVQSGQWWISIFPAIAIASLVIAINLIADSIDKVFNE